MEGQRTKGREKERKSVWFGDKNWINLLNASRWQCGPKLTDCKTRHANEFIDGWQERWVCVDECVSNFWHIRKLWVPALKKDDITRINYQASDLIGSRCCSSSLVSAIESPSVDISSSERSSVVIMVSTESLSPGSGGQLGATTGDSGKMTSCAMTITTCNY